ncbi:MAG: NADH-quinone oxidoreductase subunit E, partial [Pseudomonadota bacterium]
GLTTLKDFDSGHTKFNASVQLATDIGDTVKRIDGTEVPLIAPWQGKAANAAAKPKAAPKKTTQPAPRSQDAPAPAPETEGTRPETLDAARDGKADNLKMIKGVGPKLEALLNRLGFYHFDQIAAWTMDEVAWVDQNLEGFKGRVTRDKWVVQASDLATGAETEFSKRAKKDDIYKNE